MSVIELLLPRTDAGAAAQAAGAVVIFVPLLWVLRRHREMRIFVLGVATITFAWFALRTVH
ncbi:MAG: hypothetical protein ACRD29_11215 [Acidimicrobiales bacterium]